MYDDDRISDYARAKAALVPLRRTSIRNVEVTIGQLREGKERSQNMVLMIERNDYDPGQQYIIIRMSTVRRVVKWIHGAGWMTARRLGWFEKLRLNRNAKRMAKEKA